VTRLVARWLPYLAFALPLASQTVCGNKYSQPGVLICYPTSADGELPDIFHLSAQANAAPGQSIRRYSVLLDGRKVYDSRLGVASTQLSIETNIYSPFSSGTHKLTLYVDGAGSAESLNLSFHPSTSLGFCDTFSRIDVRSCVPVRNSTPLFWNNPAGAGATDPWTLLDQRHATYSTSLRRVEADTADAMAIDPSGNLYTATHSSADIEVRKYLPDGSMRYDRLLRLCGTGFVSVRGLAIDDAGHLWLAGNTSGCLAASPGAAFQQVAEPGKVHGFVAKIDTTKPESDSLLYLTWLAPVENRIHAMRVDPSGIVYVAGESKAANFPGTGGAATEKSVANKSPVAFVAAVNPEGSALISSKTFASARLNALALDPAGTVYVTGSSRADRGTVDSLLIIGLADQGRRVVYSARMGDSGLQEGRAIGITQDGASTWLLVSGATNSLPRGERGVSQSAPQLRTRPYTILLQPCRNGPVYARMGSVEPAGKAVEIALQPALDAVVSSLNRIEVERLDKAGSKVRAAVSVAPNCSSPLVK
jgi:hypothetical protein